MKLSIEARVAAAVATAFVALTVGVIGQENSVDQSASPNSPTTHREVSTHISHHGYDSSLGGYTNAEEKRFRTQWQLRE
jgi:hypothetical protein